VKTFTHSVGRCFEGLTSKANIRRGPMWLLLLCLSLCLPACAQRNTGSIVGLVTDSTDAAISNTAITVTNVIQA
jgi:hypothetical protein